MKKTFLIVSVILGLALCPLSADDYVDDAYYWDGPTPGMRSSSKEVSHGVVTQTVKKVPVSVQPAPQKASDAKVTNRPVTPQVEFIQVRDTVVKAVIHRKNQ